MESVLVPSLKSGFNFFILQASGDVLGEIDRSHNWVIPERSSIPEALVSSKLLSILNAEF